MKVYIFTRPSPFGRVGEVVKVVGATTPVGADLNLTNEEIAAAEALGWKVSTTNITQQQRCTHLFSGDFEMSPKRQSFEHPPEEPNTDQPSYDTDEPPRLEGDESDDNGREELD